MFAGDKRDLWNAVKGLKAGFPEEEDRPSSKEGAGVSYSSFKENRGRCCAEGKESDVDDIFRVFWGFSELSKVDEKRKKGWSCVSA